MTLKFLLQVNYGPETRNVPDIERLRLGLARMAREYLTLATEGKLPDVTCLIEEATGPMARSLDNCPSCDGSGRVSGLFGTAHKTVTCFLCHGTGRK